MANKKRTQTKRNKRLGKKQRRRTAAKQRGGMISPTSVKAAEAARNYGLATARQSTIRTIEPAKTLTVYIIVPLDAGLGMGIFHKGQFLNDDIHGLIDNYKTQIYRGKNYIASNVLYKTTNEGIELIFASTEMYERYIQEQYQVEGEVWMNL